MRPTLAVCCAALIASATPQPIVGFVPFEIAAFSPSRQQPSFQSTVDLVAVDVQVVDDQGRAIRTLHRDDFEVFVDRERRPVVSAQLVDFGTSDATRVAAASTGRPAPAGDRDRGRTFMLAIDAKSFEPGGTLPIIEAALEFVAATSDADRIGLFTLGTGGARVTPTTDRLVLRQALSRTAGQKTRTGGQFHLSVSEVIDIMSAAPNALVASTTVAPQGGRGTVAQMVDMADPLQRVQSRECGRTTDAGCTAMILAEAATLAHDLEDRASQTLEQLSMLLGALRGETSGRITIVLLSAGIPLSDRPGGRVDVGGEVRALGEQAAHANATIYALHIDLGLAGTYAAQSRRVGDPGVMNREYRLSDQLLEQFADAAGGTRLGVPVGNGSTAFARVLRETAAYYLLAVDPGTVARDGRAHRLQVRVGGRGYTLRSRQWVVLPKIDRYFEPRTSN